MSQVLLRLPDDLHDRVRHRAQREGQSINSAIVDILDAVVDADLAQHGNRRRRLRDRAVALHCVGQPARPAVTEAPTRDELVVRSAGIGSWLLADLAAGRDDR